MSDFSFQQTVQASVPSTQSMSLDPSQGDASREGPQPQETCPLYPTLSATVSQLQLLGQWQDHTSWLEGSVPIGTYCSGITISSITLFSLKEPLFG